MTENRALSPYRAASELTMWFTETMWLPFIEDETGNITGPGHQDKEAFARLVNDYDQEVAGDLDWAEQAHITHEDVSHAYATVFEDGTGEVWFKPATSHSPGVVPITTVWGVR